MQDMSKLWLGGHLWHLWKRVMARVCNLVQPNTGLYTVFYTAHNEVK